MAMYELSIIRNIPPKKGNPGWVDMIHLAMNCDDIEEWTKSFVEIMKGYDDGILYTFISHYEEFNSSATYAFPPATEVEHIK